MSQDLSQKRFETAEDVRAFFKACDTDREELREPDWEEHRLVLENSIRSGYE